MDSTPRETVVVDEALKYNLGEESIADLHLAKDGTNPGCTGGELETLFLNNNPTPIAATRVVDKEFIGATVTNASMTDGPLYVFVKKEPGTAGAYEHFKKYDPILADDGWWFKPQHEKEIAEICRQSNNTLNYRLKPLPLPIGFNEYKTMNTFSYWNDRLNKNEASTRAILIQKRIIEDDCLPPTEYLYEQLSKIPEGKALVEEYLKIKLGLQRIKNQENITHIQPSGDRDAASVNLNQDDQEFTKLLDPNSEDKIVSELKNVSVGIDTGYTIGEASLAFPGGAISIVAAPTSHGKTTALMNFSLGVLKNNAGKNVYFFTHEESSASILISFLSIYIGEEISKNNRGSIEHFFRSTEDKYKYIAQNAQSMFLTQKESFFRNLIGTRRLKVYYSELTADRLVAAIQFIKSNDPNVGMICVDYMQLLRLAMPGRSARQEELKQICLLLNDCAVKTGLPIVLAAQFNRTVVSEADMSPIAIGEAGDIERIASLIIGIFNRSFDFMTTKGNVSKVGPVIGRDPAIYVEVLKGRKIGNNHSCVMGFNGNTGVISNIKSNEPSPAIDGFKNMQNKEKGATTKQSKTYNQSLVDLAGT